MIPTVRNLISDCRPGMLRGLKHGLRNQPGLAVHLFFAVMVMMTAAVLECSWLEWSLIVLSLGAVIGAELFRGAVDSLAKGPHRDMNAAALAAGGVLAVMAASTLVCGIVIVHRLIAFVN